jgi:hypothetical protein
MVGTVSKLANYFVLFLKADRSISDTGQCKERDARMTYVFSRNDNPNKKRKKKPTTPPR